jgi:hypothetical protein
MPDLLLLSAQPRKLSSFDRPFSHTVGDPIRLFHLTVGDPTSCPGNPYTHKHHNH